MRELERSLRLKWPVEDVLLIRRIGELSIGDIISVAAASAEHRESAFGLCQDAVNCLQKIESLQEKEVFEKRRSRLKPKNHYNRMEWGGAFGDLGTLIPFVVAYITVVGIDPLGLLFMFGICKIAAGLYYKTPVPIQPMKAIGAAAIAGGASPFMIFGAGITTGLFWFILGITGTIKVVGRLVSKPVARGIILGLGLSFMVEGIKMMRTTPFACGYCSRGYLSAFD
jgi:Molybdopterin converting factor, large subunit